MRFGSGALLGQIADPTAGKRSFVQRADDAERSELIKNSLRQQQAAFARQQQEEQAKKELTSRLMQFEQSKNLSQAEDDAFLHDMMSQARSGAFKSAIGQVRMTPYGKKRNELKDNIINQFRQQGLYGGLTNIERVSKEAAAYEDYASAKKKTQEAVTLQDKNQVAKELSVEFQIQGLSKAQADVKAIQSVGSTMAKGEQYALAQGLKPGTPGYTKFIKDFALKSGTTIHNHMGKDKLRGTLSEKFGETIYKHSDDAVAAEGNLNIIGNQEKLLNDGMYTGIIAPWKVKAGKLLQEVGINFMENPAKNSEAYAAHSGKLVGQVIKDFGSGTGLSDADRIYAQKIAAGEISMSEGALRLLIEMNKRISYSKMARANDYIDRLSATGENPKMFGLKKFVLPKNYNTRTGVVKALAEAGYDENGRLLKGKTATGQQTPQGPQAQQQQPSPIKRYTDDKGDVVVESVFGQSYK